MVCEVVEVEGEKIAEALVIEGLSGVNRARCGVGQGCAGTLRAALVRVDGYGNLRPKALSHIA